MSLRNLSAAISRYSDECGVVRDELWSCDITISPDGEDVAAKDRIAEIKQRYGLDHLVTTFISGAEPELLAAAERTKRRLAAVERG